MTFRLNKFNKGNNTEATILNTNPLILQQVFYIVV